MSCRNAGIYSKFHALNRMRAQTPFIQSLLIPYLAEDDFGPNGLVVDLIHAPAPATGMVLAGQLIERGLSVAGLGVKPDLLAPDVKNVFLGLGLIAGQEENELRSDRRCTAEPLWRAVLAWMEDPAQRELSARARTCAYCRREIPA